MVNKADVVRYLENWQDEIESAFLYRALARAEKQPALAQVYRKLAATEESHAQFWEEKLRSAGHPPASSASSVGTSKITSNSATGMNLLRYRLWSSASCRLTNRATTYRRAWGRSRTI